jgi:hypothetical protein
VSPGDSTVHTIRNRLQVLLLTHEKSCDHNYVEDEIRRIDALLSTLDEKVSCPLKKDCPFFCQPEPAGQK